MPIIVTYLRLTLERHELISQGYRDTDDVLCLLEQLQALREEMDTHERAGVLLVDRLLGRYEP